MPQQCKTHGHKAGAPDLPSKLPCCSLPQFPSGIGSEEWGSRHAFAAQTRTVHLHLAPDAMPGGSHSPLLPGKEFAGFSSPMKLKQIRTSKDLVSFTMLQKSAFVFQHPLANSFRVPGLLLGHVVNPAMSNDGKCSGFSPLKSVSAGQTPLSNPLLQSGVSCQLCLQPPLPLPLCGPQPLASGLPSLLAPLVQPIEFSPHMPQVFRSSIHELLSSCGCSCSGSREKVRKG